ncbi:restriction endonuclease subunit S [Rossellomorea marisflavi]|uniref:restriction endonuclease subunit S n=1 Tax=Rossellomorea marisflavi TaxID=189381 RepID=UPI00345845C6
MSKEQKTTEKLNEDAIVREDQLYEIPNNWVWTKFGSVAKLFNGYAFKSTDYQEEGIPIIRISDISGEYTTPEKAVRVSSRLYNERFLVRKGDLLIAMSGATTGKTGIYNSEEKALQNQRVGNIKEFNQSVLYYKYKNYFVLNNTKEILKKAYGGAQPNISGKLIESLNFPLPPLNEQKRIAEKVERLMNKIDEAKKLIEDAKETFELRRASILDKVFRGDITKKWRKDTVSLFVDPNLGDGIFPRNGEVNMVDIPDNWRWITAEHLFVEKPRNGFSPKSVEIPTETKTLKLGAITKGYFKDGEYKYIDEKIPEDSHLWLKNGDFLIQRANSIEYVGTAAIFTGSDNEFIYPDLIMKGKLNTQIILPEYMVLWVNSLYGKKYIRENATGTAGNMPKINQRVVKSMPIPLPPIEEQKEILRVYENVINEEVTFNLEQASGLLDELNNGVLSKAFRGELGTNDPTEESALELLKEILFDKIK